MSMIEPGQPEPVEATPRKRLTRAERIAILQRQQHCCARPCGGSLIWSWVEDRAVYGPMVDEHIVPLELGGSNDLSNRELRCIDCAKAKTRADRKVIAKVAARIRRRLAGRRSARSRRSGRGGFRAIRSVGRMRENARRFL